MEAVINDMELLIEESVNDEVHAKREQFEKLFEGVGRGILDRWFKLPDYEFYTAVSERINQVKMLDGHKPDLVGMLSDIEKYIGFKGEELEDYFLNTEDGKEQAKKITSLPLPRLALACSLGYVRFTGEALVLTGAYTGRVGGFFVQEVARAVVKTAKFAREDGRNYVGAIKSSYKKHKYEKPTLDKILKARM